MGSLVLLMRRLLGVPLAVEPSTLEAFLLAIGPRAVAGGEDVSIEVPSGLVRPRERTAAALAAAARSRPGLPERLRGAVPYDHAAERDEEHERGGVAVIPIHGELVARDVRAQAMSGDFVGYDALAARVTDAANDPRVRGIVLDFDSPGGEMHGSFECADAIRAAASRKNVIALANPYAMSAAYLLACAASRVMVPPTGSVGSVGVYAAHLDASAQDAARGLRYTFVSAGKGKLDGNPHAPLGDEARGRLQGLVDEAYGMFVGHVAQARGMDPDRVRELGAARLGGKSAVEAGLADEVGNLEKAIDAARRPAANTFPAGERASARGPDAAWHRRTA